MKAIVIPCFNRVEALSRLLGSLELASYSEEVALVFCLDYSDNDATGRLIDAYEWDNGPKVVHRHPKNIGLRENILFSGDLTRSYDGVIVLEDDSIVSPDFFKFVLAASDFYSEDDAIAQIALYSYECDEIVRDQFHPSYVGLDVFMMRWACSWGQYWSQRQWADFRKWYGQYSNSNLKEFRIPPSVKRWKETSWKKYFMAYLADADKWVIYPYHGYVSNYGDTGQHLRKLCHPLVQVPIALAAPSHFRFKKSQDIVVRYDSYFQPESSFLNYICPALGDFDYTVDLNMCRTSEEIETPYLLSCRSLKGEAAISFGNGLFPVDLNFSIPQEQPGIFLAKVSSFEERLSFRSRVTMTAWTRRLFLKPSTDFKYSVGRALLGFSIRLAGSSKLKKIRNFFS